MSDILLVTVQSAIYMAEKEHKESYYQKRDELLAAGAKEVWFVFPESHLVEFYGSEGKRAVTQFIVDLTEFWHSY